MPLAIIGLVCPEARVKFKNIDFRTEADFACYYNIMLKVDLGLLSNKIQYWNLQFSSIDFYLASSVTLRLAIIGCSLNRP
jgi:hypothetical protein